MFLFVPGPFPHRSLALVFRYHIPPVSPSQSPPCSWRIRKCRALRVHGVTTMFEGNFVRAASSCLFQVCIPFSSCLLVFTPLCVCVEQLHPHWHRLHAGLGRPLLFRTPLGANRDDLSDLSPGHCNGVALRTPEPCQCHGDLQRPRAPLRRTAFKSGTTRCPL